MSRPWFPLYVPDLLADTMHLTSEEMGAYVRILCHQWMRTNVPTNVEQTCRISGASPAVTQAILDQYFQQTEDGWRNARLHEESEKANAISKVRSEARAKRGSKEPTKEPTSDGTKEPTIDDTTTTTTTSKKKNKNTVKFDEWWALWPKKVSKANALKVWQQRDLDAHADILIAALPAQIAQPNWQDKQYIPNPDTYLRGARWEDEAIKEQAHGSSQQNRPTSAVDRAHAAEERFDNRLEREGHDPVLVAHD